jgi:23S rRNA (cytosine1962-C5)-methyltransferase
MEVNRNLITEILVELCRPKGIIERSDTSTRYLEELPERSGCIYGTCPESLVIMDNNLKFRINLMEGQRAEYFLDQSANRGILAKYARGRRTLDCFCHIGSFAVHAAAYGATSVLGVDISEDAVNQAEANAALNSVADRCRFKVANAFDFLRDQVGKKEIYDLVILDPPAFTKGKQVLDGAIRSYKEINLRGLKLLQSGGILITCACSNYLSSEQFWEIIAGAAADNKQRIRLLERRSQGLDHPVLVGVPETEYLKCYIFEVL